MLAGRPPVMEVEQLGKDSGRLRAVAEASSRVARGEVYALLGPDSAGKTSTVEILQDHRAASSGSVRVLGTEPASGGRRLRGWVGIVPAARWRRRNSLPL
jgi:ABC-2 type transport system ATP-binding protein